MDEPKTKEQVLQAMNDSHAEMSNYLASLTPEQRVAPVLDNSWSVKDSLAHLAAWQKMTVGWLEASLRGEDVKRWTPDYQQPDDPAQWNVVINAFNDYLYERDRNRSWDEIMDDLNSGHDDLSMVVQLMSPADIFDPNRFAWRKGSPAIDMIGGNTYGHYEEHLGYMQQAFGK